MSLVVFVGDKPSLKNDNPEVAFVGTPSYTTLCSWINEMNVFDYVLINSEAGDIEKLIEYDLENYIFVALGAKAASVLDVLEISYFALPHPSPRNRVLNDRPLVASKLKDCKRYIRSEMLIRQLLTHNRELQNIFYGGDHE